MRIDRAKQDFERIRTEPRTLPLRIKVSARAKILDGTSFEQSGAIYVLAEAIAPGANRLCRAPDGERTACGLRARVALKRLVSNRTLDCKELTSFARVRLVSCSVQEKDLAKTLVRAGLAWSATADLFSEQQEAMSTRSGIWIDAGCVALRRCPKD
ncbi:MAG: thermonuclease family protein [Shinella sp.]|nr:thermonuclease family protein [Shinella sp.]